MKSIGNWGRRSLIVESGRRGGEQDGRMGGVIERRLVYELWLYKNRPDGRLGSIVYHGIGDGRFRYGGLSTLIRIHYILL